MPRMKDSKKILPWWVIPGGVLSLIVVVGTFMACIPTPIRDQLVQLADRSLSPGGSAITTVPTPEPDHAPRIQIAQARTLSDAYWVDVRSHGEYLQGHIPGAYSLPSHLVEARYHELPKNRTIVLYCT